VGDRLGLAVGLAVERAGNLLGLVMGVDEVGVRDVGLNVDGMDVVGVDIMGIADVVTSVFPSKRTSTRKKLGKGCLLLLFLAAVVVAVEYPTA